MTTPSVKIARTKLPENNLDVLRAIAVLLVLADHTIESCGDHSRLVMWLGLAGVQAFFVHTSLVLMSSLERDSAPTKAGWMKRFYVRRALRIYPLVWAVIALVLVFKVPAGLIPAAYYAPTPSSILANIVLMQDIAGLPNLQVVMWSLPIEVQMYIVLPFLYLIARSRKWWPMAVVLLLALASVCFYRWGNDPSHRITGLWRLPVLQYAPSFSMGVLAYHLLRRRTNEGVISSRFWFFYVLACVVATGAVVTSSNLWITRIALCALLGVAIPLVQDSAPSFLTRAAHTVAVYSYGIYLLHMSALRFGFSYLKEQPFVLQCVAAIATLTIGCYLGHHLVEKPGIALGKRLLGEHTKTNSLEATAPAP